MKKVRGRGGEKEIGREIEYTCVYMETDQFETSDACNDMTSE